MDIYSHCRGTGTLIHSFTHAIIRTNTHASSPVIVADDADIDVTAKRIVWGKFLNTGQTCIAPDYVLCPPDKQEKLVQCCKQALEKYFGEVQ